MAREEWFQMHCDGTQAIRDANLILERAARDLAAVGLERMADRIAKAADLTVRGHELVSDAVGLKITGDAAHEERRSLDMLSAVLAGTELGKDAAVKKSNSNRT